LGPRRYARKHRSHTLVINVKGDKCQRLVAWIAPLMHEPIWFVDEGTGSLCFRLAVDGVRARFAVISISKASAP
jgi:hypothetical protein